MSDLKSYQISQLLKGKPRYVGPTFSGDPYLCPEIFTGDTVDYSEGGYSGGYPIPTNTVQIQLAGVNQGSSYTVQSGDAGKSLQIRQTVANPRESITRSSASATVQNPQTFYGLGRIGGGVYGGADWQPARFFNNATFDGRGFGVQGTHTGGGIALDSDGWPTQASEIVVTAANTTGVDGNLAAGTYHCSFQSVGQTSVVTLGVLSGASISNIVNQPDGITTTFELTVGAGAVAGLYFSGAIQYLDIPRDGSTPSATLPTFTSESLAFHAQFKSLRLMDFCDANSATDTTWAGRAPYGTCIRRPYSWEVIVDFINAIKAYPGSVLEKVWINTSGYIDTGYATALATLIDGRIMSGLTVFVEVSNETWNSSFAVWSNFINSAATETQAIANYGMTTKLISSVVGNGTTATVTLNANLPAFVTNGAPMMMYDAQTSLWQHGTLASPKTVTVTGSNTFTFPCSTNGTMTPTDQTVFYFNLTSTLLTDELSYNLYYLVYKWYVRKTYETWTAWNAVRPQDRFVLNLQTYPTGTPVHYTYGCWLHSGNAASGIDEWLYGTAIAPYIQIPSSVNAALTGNQTSDLDSLFASLNSELTTTGVSVIRQNISNALRYGVRPMSYEGGPDTQLVSYGSYVYQPLMHSDSRMGDLVTALLDVWMQNGGDEFHFYYVTPSTFATAAQGCWSALQTYADTSSPKIAAIINYESVARYYNNINGNPGAALASNKQSYVGSGGMNSSSTPTWYWYVQTSLRTLEMVVVANRTRRYSCTVWGTDSAAGTVASVYIDNVLAGTVTLPQNGAASNNATVATACTAFTVTLASGPHAVRIELGANIGTSPGVHKVVFALA